MLETWVLLSLIALLVYGLSQVVNKTALRDISAPSYIFISVFITIPVNLFLLVSFLYVNGSWGASLEYTIFGILSTAFGAMGYYLFEEALQRGPVTAVGSITAAYPIIPVLVGLTLLSESIKAIQAVGIAVIMIGIIMLSYTHGNGEGKSKLTTACLFFSFASLILWGLWGIFIKVALTEDVGLEVLQYIGLHAFVTPILAGLYLNYRKSQGEKIIPKWSIPVKIAFIAVILGQLAFWGEVYALESGPVSIVIPLVAAYPAMTMLLATLLLRERLRNIELIFVIAIVIGIIMVSTV